MVGSAIYVETAISAKLTWNMSALEAQVEGEDRGELTGRFRRMCHGTIPTIRSCREIQKKLKCGHLAWWRNFPYWALLSTTQSGPGYIENALREVEGPVKRCVWVNPPETGFPNQWLRYETSVDMVKSVAEYENVEALIILTAWAREARAHNHLRPSFQSALRTRQIFAKVVCHSPHLFIRWPLLAEKYRLLIWSTPDIDYSGPWFDMHWKDLPKEMENEARKATQHGVKLPPKKYFRQINKYH